MVSRWLARSLEFFSFGVSRQENLLYFVCSGSVHPSFDKCSSCLGEGAIITLIHVAWQAETTSGSEEGMLPKSAFFSLFVLVFVFLATVFQHVNQTSPKRLNCWPSVVAIGEKLSFLLGLQRRVSNLQQLTDILLSGGNNLGIKNDIREQKRTERKGQANSVLMMTLFELLDLMSLNQNDS